MKHIIAMVLLLSSSMTYAGSYTYRQDGGMTFGWQSSDMFTLFSVANTVMKITTKEVDSSDSHHSTTWLKGWSLASNATFYGLYPYSSEYKSMTYDALPVSYTSQTQTGNDKASHLAAYDYMTSQTTSSDDAMSMTYKHLGCIMRIAAYVPEDKAFTSLTLTAMDDTEWFTTEATVNATNDVMTPTATATTATLELSNVVVAAGDSLIAYVMTAPTTAPEGKSMLLTINAEDGTALQTYVKGCTMQTGKVYPVSVGNENYFRHQTGGNANGVETPFSLQVGTEESTPTDLNQIMDIATYGADFTADTEHKMKSFLLGDVDLDGVVDVTDAVIVINHYQARTTDELDLNIADVNGDGEIDVTDAVGIINIYQNKQ